MRKFTKLIITTLALTLSFALLTACSSDSSDTTASSTNTQSSTITNTTDTTDAVPTGLITIVSREDGSGTRGAFTEITGVDDGDDRTSMEAVVQNSTGGVMTYVTGDAQAIGYISLGSLDSSVKALEVDGVYPSTETILDGSYGVARPFNLAYSQNETLDPIAEELLDFIFSEEGQAIVSDAGYIPVEITTDTFETQNPSGTISVGGSSSVYPLMEKLVEAYNELNTSATIDIQSVGSSSGMTGAIDGTFDIGMASRNMKDSELETLVGIPCAMDGIVIIVNTQNPLIGLTMEEIMNIYIGEVTKYDELN